MAPERAFFMWVGDGPIPWLRRLAIDSFMRHNPSWKTDLIRLPPDEHLQPAQITDISRYAELADNGGVYFDTDIVFFGPVPDKVYDMETGISIDKTAFGASAHPVAEHMPGFNNLAMLVSEPGNSFFRHVHHRALERLEWLDDDGVDLTKYHYQAFGTSLLNREFYSMNKEDIERAMCGRVDNLPMDWVLPVRWDDSRRIFSGEKPAIPDNAFGLHWYGGSVDAHIYENNYDQKTFDRKDCLLTDVIRRAMS